MATVDMHCKAKAKNIIKAIEAPKESSERSTACNSTESLVGLHAVDRAESADNHFAGGQGRNQADADFPVETQRLDHGFDGLADRTGVAVGNLGRLAVLAGQAGEHPENDRRRQDDRTGAAQKDL